MSNELNNIVANTDGVREGIAIGGDRWPGLRFLDVLLRFEADPNVKTPGLRRQRQMRQMRQMNL